MSPEERKAQNIQAVQDAKTKLALDLSIHGLAMTGWGKANAYNCISQLLTYCRKNIRELNCFKPEQN